MKLNATSSNETARKEFERILNKKVTGVMRSCPRGLGWNGGYWVKVANEPMSYYNRGNHGMWVKRLVGELYF